MTSPSLSTFVIVIALLLSCFAFFPAHAIEEGVDEASMSIGDFLDYNIYIFNQGINEKVNIITILAHIMI